ncbi:hypothetical protein HPB48_002296 [Haemaphysalis longicornis]|uniref:receptor protein-tyrosine kinase n=1 Tax=Haemaphysalis longicornis TaxID=44386 RepID=A0A9J6F806_HAELO|nr:hypothetical protein HPB48_002296 [Haemaphysalis longicornis]
MRSPSWILWILVAFVSAPGPPGVHSNPAIKGSSPRTSCYSSGDGHVLPAPRTMYIKGQPTSIVIETTQRTTHRLITHMFEIMVTELLGYGDVRIRRTDRFDPESAFQRLSGCLSPHTCNATTARVPESMINLELWMGPAYNPEPWVNTGLVEDIGPLGPIGRYGWYVSQSTVQDYWNNYTMVVDHWRSFRSPNMTSLLNRLGDVKLQKFLNSTNGSLCNFTDCRGNVYVPPVCLQGYGGTPCATLIADFPGACSRQLALPDRLKSGFSAGAYRSPDYPRILLFNFASVSVTDFLRRYFDKINLVALCIHLNHSLFVKVVWSQLKEAAPDVYELVEKITFTQKQYDDLLYTYMNARQRHKSYQEIACSFLSTNEQLLHQFISVRIGDKPKLYIGGIFPMSGIYKRMGGVLTAAHMAMDAVNRDPKILVDYRLKILEEDGECAQDVVMKRYIKYVTSTNYKHLIGILGPACTETLEPIVAVAQHYNTAIISYSAEGALFSKREKYPYFFRTIPENHIYRFVYLKLLEALQWRRVAALTEDGHKYSEYLNLLHDDMQKLGLTFIANRKFPHDHSSHNGTHKLHDMAPFLADLKARNARIIIGGFDEDAARAVMCEAYKQGMTGKEGYQWFLPTWLAQQERRNEQWYNTEYYNQRFNESVNCTLNEMKSALEGYMSLHPKAFADDNATMQDNKTVADWRKQYKMLALSQTREASTVCAARTSPAFRELIRLINATDFHGVSGHVRFYRSTRLTDVIIRQWVNGSQLHATDRLALGPPLRPIFWPSGRNQGDGSEEPVLCPLEWLRNVLNTSCDLAIVVANVIGLSIFALLMIGCCVVFKKRYEQKVKQTEARMRELGLLTSNHLPSLDGWELPRDHIVINRKLGEGAFGTVFGGEALVTEQCWQAVAVKTLKVNAHVEEKLDFLSEAEMMKRFDHKNIVRLLGVCTTGEPVYTVMEFMLYGDLKTYLLARRHLVKECDRNKSEEVSDRCLTAMALDVARGLSYLADLKYVHRDLACRNCLVNAGRTVKIGDFGMCRPMYDSDYYRFNKRGMLPVRWMAPESLNDGIFTTMSDVWSYGVLLYEIVTFASFPYQGLSNNQVLEYVKGYNTLPVPNGCKPELEALLLRCWARSPSQRPTACEIVEILANDSKLISPCLDLPPASIQVEGTDSLELSTIGDRGRLHSISSLARRVESSERASAVGQPQPGSPAPLQRNQYVTLRQLSRAVQCGGQNVTSF